ncbi:hypothetical protein CDL12_18277 [Handroanthus impetiginosus]|uniref:Uncharacterized protein n=1 Tax=Handroanthus impetiginosus TaxID=429701 RepID=A0A2G9GV75_9LAMI|nr:hypothetical protein CDL12_18277 [Handroanthus impetiginosus]
MENDAIISKDVKVERQSPSHEVEVANYSCLCSPTTHAGSFRCRLHQVPRLHRTRSMDSQSIVTPSSYKLTQNNAVNFP